MKIDPKQPGPAPDSEADWVVVNRNDPSLRWSNEHGWVEHGFDTFGANERATLALPIEGKWEAKLAIRPPSPST